MAFSKTRLILLFSLLFWVLTSCTNGPPEKVHFQLEEDFEGLIQVVVEDGIRPVINKNTLVLDIPSSGVVHVESWPNLYRLSGSQGGEALPSMYSDNREALPDDQKRLHGLGSTTLADGRILIWFVLGTKEDQERVKEELMQVAPRYLEYNSRYKMQGGHDFESIP